MVLTCPEKSRKVQTCLEKSRRVKKSINVSILFVKTIKTKKNWLRQRCSGKAQKVRTKTEIMNRIQHWSWLSERIDYLRWIGNQERINRFKNCWFLGIAKNWQNRFIGFFYRDSKPTCSKINFIWESKNFLGFQTSLKLYHYLYFTFVDFEQIIECLPQLLTTLLSLLDSIFIKLMSNRFIWESTTYILCCYLFIRFLFNWWTTDSWKIF